MNGLHMTHFCIICGREFRPRDADTVICPDCGGPPEAPAPSQPQETVLADQPRGTVLMSQPAYQRMCILCGQDFTTPDPQADRCPQCRGEAPHPQPEIRSRPESRQPTPAMPAPAQGTVAMPESGLSPAPSSADVPLTWNAGDVILDLYEVKGELGKGGMGVVYRVHHRQWNIDLAVKTPLPEALQKAGSLENFLREAQAWVDLGLHPHIVTCYYVRRLGEMPRVFAECMEGGSLKNWMEDGRLYAGGEQEALKRILDCAIQFAWGLGYAHEKGLVHQDVKPANALMTPDGMLKVTDFGLVGAKGYTPAYAAPEQELGQAVSPRTDIWGWGVSVLEMFTGGVHWQFGSVAASVLENYLQEAPPEGIPPMPAALAELLRQCFQNDPDQRPASMDEVAERLMRLYEQETGAPYPRQKPQALELRADSLNNKAVSLLDLGQEEEAVRCWQEALQADPAHLEANFNYGYYRWQRAELTGSEFLKQLQQLESTHGSDPEYWRLLGWVYLEQGYVEEVEEILEKRGVKDEALRRAHTAPDRPVGREVRRFEGHTNGASSAAFSPDGHYVLSGGGDGTVRLWDVATGQEVRRFEGHTNIVWSVAFSPDGRYALSGSEDKTIRLWDLATGQEVRKIDGHTGLVSSVVFSPDGRYALSGSGDRTIRLWDLATGQEMRRFMGHRDRVSSVTFSADGHYALSGSWDKTIRLWNVANGQEIHCFAGGSIGVRSVVACSPDGCYVLSGSYNEVLCLLDIATGREVCRFEGHTDKVTFVAFSPDGRYALSGSWDNTVRLWDVTNRREVRCFDKHTGFVLSVTFAPDGRYILSASVDNTLRLWEVFYPPFCPSKAHPFPSLTRVQSNIELVNEQELYAKLFQKAEKALMQGVFSDAYACLRQAQRLPNYARDGKILQLLSYCGQKGRRKKYIRDSWCIYRLETTDWVLSVTFSPNRRYVLTAGADGTLHLWDIASGQEMHRFNEHTDLVTSVAFSSDGNSVLSGSYDSTLILWNVANRRGIRHFKGHSDKVWSVAISPDGRFALSASEDRTVRIWNIATGCEIHRLEGHVGEVLSAVFSPDGRYALSGSKDKTLWLWNVTSGRKVHQFEGHTGAVLSVTFSPDGRYALSGGADKIIRMWDTVSAREIRQFEGHTEHVHSVVFSPDGRYVLSGSGDNTIRLWDIASGQQIHCLVGHTDWVYSAVFSLDGHYVCSGSGDRTIRVWFLDWDYDFPAPADWDEGARPYLDIFLTLHTPYGPDGLRRVGKPQWTEEDFQKLLQELGYRGYGWLRPEGVRRELEKMAKERK
jgi:WD40 repeat protein/serine/threonine protein kinase/DNA-directed RNA polymerase subunit RPC12/RpoP